MSALRIREVSPHDLLRAVLVAALAWCLLAGLAVGILVSGQEGGTSIPAAGNIRADETAPLPLDVDTKVSMEISSEVSTEDSTEGTDGSGGQPQGVVGQRSWGLQYQGEGRKGGSSIGI